MFCVVWCKYEDMEEGGKQESLIQRSVNLFALGGVYKKYVARSLPKEECHKRGEF